MLQLHCCRGNQNLHTVYSYTLSLWYREESKVYIKLDLFVFMWFWEKWCRLCHTRSAYFVWFFSCQHFCLWSILCLWMITAHTDSVSLACALAAPLSAQAPDLQGTLSLPYSQAQRGLTPLGSDPHTHLAPHIHSFILWISQVLSPLSPSPPPFFLLCVPWVIFRWAKTMNRMSIFSLTPLFPFSVPVYPPNASVCLWIIL